MCLSQFPNEDDDVVLVGVFDRNSNQIYPKKEKNTVSEDNATSKQIEKEAVGDTAAVERKEQKLIVDVDDHHTPEVNGKDTMQPQEASSIGQCPVNDSKWYAKLLNNCTPSTSRWSPSPERAFYDFYSSSSSSS